jgi:hypothetical protein
MNPSLHQFSGALKGPCKNLELSMKPTRICPLPPFLVCQRRPATVFGLTLRNPLVFRIFPRISR